MATPPNQTMTVSFSPLLPAGKIQLYKQMPMGHLIKVIITYKKVSKVGFTEMTLVSLLKMNVI